MPLFDLTRPIFEGMAVWPGDAPVVIARQLTLPALSSLSLSSHSGTHVDAPAHFIAGGATVEQLPLDVLVGPAWVVQVRGAGPLTAGDLAAAEIPPGVIRLLIRTDNSERPRAATTFDPDFVGLAADAAGWLLARGIRLVGIDGPSIEPYQAPGEPVHHALLRAGVVLVENLALEAIAPGAYQLICLPLPLVGGDGAPARVILIQD